MRAGLEGCWRSREAGQADRLAQEARPALTGDGLLQDVGRLDVGIYGQTVATANVTCPSLAPSPGQTFGPRKPGADASFLLVALDVVLTALHHDELIAALEGQGQRVVGYHVPAPERYLKGDDIPLHFPRP